MPAIVGQPTLSDLLIEQSKDDILAAELALATSLNLPVTSWQAGDPTRSLLIIESELVAALEQVAVGFISSGFLDFAEDKWLSILAQEQFGVLVPAATFASTDVVLTNTGGGIYVIEPGDLTFKNIASSATYHNTTGGTLTGVSTPGATLTLTIEADLPGSASSAAAHEIALVTALLGVNVDNANPAVGLDEQPRATTVQQCRNMAASLSPNGPAAAYAFVALNPLLTGITTPTRVRVYPDSTSGNVLIYVAGAAGDLPSGDVAKVQAAIEKWATPLCITPTVVSATAFTVNVTFEAWFYQSIGQSLHDIGVAIFNALQGFFQERPIGGDMIPPSTVGELYREMILGVISRVFPDSTFRVDLTVPNSDIVFTQGQVPILGAVVATAIHIIPDPT